MLRTPYTKYSRLFVYHFNKHIPEPDNDQDFIGAWQEDECTILFFHKEKKSFSNELCLAHKARVVYEADLDYTEWEAGITIEPFQTKMLRICPVWFPPTRTDQEILLDPSVIFGSGFHATTRLCLEALETLIPQPDLAIESVLDLGTGTGILAIASSRLGAKKVKAIDLNPLSVKVAKRNIELNAHDETVKVTLFDLKKGIPDTDHDLIIANLHKEVLLELFQNPSFWKARFYIISGFIPTMEEELLSAIPLKKLRLRDRSRREQWRCWILEKIPTGDVHVTR